MTGSTSFLYARRHFDVLPLNCADHVISFSYWPVDSWSRYIPGALLSEGKGLIKELFYIKKCILRKKTRFDLAVHYLASNCATNNVFQRCRQNAGDCSATPPPPPPSPSRFVFVTRVQFSLDRLTAFSVKEGNIRGKEGGDAITS